MGFLMTLVGVAVIAVSLFYGFNLYSESNPSDDPLGIISNPIDTVQMNLAYIVWIVGGVLGLMSVGIGKIIDILEDMKKTMQDKRPITEED